MAGIDDALERLITDTGFRAALTQDPRAALADYDLTEDERELLTSQLSQGAGASGGVEQRTSKSGLAGALGMFDDAVAAPPRDAGLDSVEVQADDAGTPQADDHNGQIEILDYSWGASQSGWVYDEDSSCWIRVSQVGAPSDQADPVMAAGGGDHEPTADTIPQEHMTLNFDKVEPTGKASVQDLTLTKYTDPAGDPDQPIIVGSLHNADEPDSAGSKQGKVEYEWKVEEGVKADGGDPTDLAGHEPTAEGNKLFVGGLSFGTDDAAPGGGQNEIQFEDAPGTEEAMPSPKLMEAIANGKAFPSDDSHEIEMDVHVGRSEPDDALTTGEPSTDTDTPPTLGDVVVVKEVD